MEDLEYLLWRLSRQLFTMMDSQGIQKPFVELSETDEGVHLTAELHAVLPQDLRVRVMESGICLKVHRGGDVVCSEVYETSRINPLGANMKFINGILDMTVPYK